MVASFSSLSLAARKGSSATMGAPAVRQVISPGGQIGALGQDDDLASSQGQGPKPGTAHAQHQHQASHLRQAAPRAAASSAAAAASPFAALAVADTSKRNLHALKVLVRLVTALNRAPASSAGDQLGMEDRLRELLYGVNRSADWLLQSLAPNSAHSGWLKASAMEAAAHLLASQIEADSHGECASVDEQLQALQAAVADAGQLPALDAILDQLSQARYVEAVDEEVAAQRVRLSTRLAAWDLYGHVSSAKLGQGTYRFTYGLAPAQIVSRLLPHALSMAREAALQTSNLEVLTAHSQSCIRRAADLLGTEYVARTRRLMNWVAEDGITDQEYTKRHAAACAGLDSRILPDVFQAARANFLAIEEMACHGIEDIHVEHTSSAQRTS